ncbi:hypothetical protein QYF36_003027 [Acer negundo]|nr:hypothetical protein QYF36_003027 [Acer negundo]
MALGDSPPPATSNPDLDPPTNRDDNHKMKNIKIDPFQASWIGFKLGSTDDRVKVLDPMWKRQGLSFLASTFIGGSKSFIAGGGRSSSNDGDF